jgi:hypothetical protein
LDSPLQIHQDVGNLRSIELRDGKCPLIILIDLRPHSLSNDTDESGRFLQPDHILQGAGEFADQSTEKYIPFEGNVRAI